MLAGLVADEGALLREALLANITAKRTLTSVCPVVTIEYTLCPEGFATEMTLVRPVIGVYTHMQL